MLSAFVLFVGCLSPKDRQKEQPLPRETFIRVDGPNLIKSNGEKFFIQGINLGNWLNPEGYMFLFQNVNCYRTINDAFSEMVGPDFTNWFWKEFKKNYITQDDIKYIKQTGMNSIRIPFHYKLFTNEDYMGLDSNHDGFELIDQIIEWCRQEGLYVILDMHDAPGGQTGDNIDDSYGYPWLFESVESQTRFCSIWKNIAEHYANDTLVLGYDLLNEPIANFFPDRSRLDEMLEPVYKRCVDSIRTVDKNHVILLAGAQWNTNFAVLKDSKFDDNIMYTCHRYWCDTLQANIQDFVDFRDKVNLPMYMGETGENSDEWIAAWTRLMERNNIGWHYWPYKKMTTGGACMLTIPTPENWDIIVKYTQTDRSSFAKIRAARPDQEVVKKALKELLENMKFANTTKNEGYIRAMGMIP
ncbi:glycoside hydrolase family 5 protein [Parabacteroides sp. OttesenSCG-928-G07]|nr:glycoside hydrolase family 5 protein [Parabacteroides sp. OttesenSCG-928-G07]